MKKLILMLATAFSFAAVSAQSRNDNYNRDDRYQAAQQDNWNNDRQGQWKDQAYNSRSNRDAQYKRQADYDRMNQQYDQRINGYRNDRSLNSYERQRRIDEAERERQQKKKSFGTGFVVGGIAAIILGAIISK